MDISKIIEDLMYDHKFRNDIHKNTTIYLEPNILEIKYNYEQEIYELKLYESDPNNYMNVKLDGSDKEVELGSGSVKLEDYKLILQDYSYTYFKSGQEHNQAIIYQDNKQLIVDYNKNTGKTTYNLHKSENNNYFLDYLENKSTLQNQSEIDIKDEILKVVIDNMGKINFINGEAEEAQKQIKTLLENVIKKSDGMDYGLNTILIYLYIASNTEQNQQQFIRLPNYIYDNKFKPERGDYNEQDECWEVKSTYFTRLQGTQEEKINQFLKDLNLIDDKNQIIQKQNNKYFVVIPFICDSHISTLLIDLRANIPYDKKIYSFDSSTYHYVHDQNGNTIKPRQDIFGDLSDCITVLSNKDLQLTGCCAFWTQEFIKVCSKKQNIWDIMDTNKLIKKEIILETYNKIKEICQPKQPILSVYDYYYMHNFKLCNYDNVYSTPEYFVKKNKTTSSFFLENYKNDLEIEFEEKSKCLKENLKIFKQQLESCYTYKEAQTSKYLPPLKNAKPLKIIRNDLNNQTILALNKNFNDIYKQYIQLSKVFIKQKYYLTRKEQKNKKKIINASKNDLSDSLELLKALNDKHKDKISINLPIEIKDIQTIIKENCHIVKKLRTNQNSKCDSKSLQTYFQKSNNIFIALKSCKVVDDKLNTNNTLQNIRKQSYFKEIIN